MDAFWDTGDTDYLSSRMAGPGAGTREPATAIGGPVRHRVGGPEPTSGSALTLVRTTIISREAPDSTSAGVQRRGGRLRAAAASADRRRGLLGPGQALVTVHDHMPAGNGERVADRAAKFAAAAGDQGATWKEGFGHDGTHLKITGADG